MVMQGEVRCPSVYVIALILLLPGIGLFGGCQQSRELPIRKGRVIARGSVTFDRFPLDQGQIAFVRADLSDPTDRDQWYEASISNGQFEIEIPPGNYAVRIHKYKYDRKKTPEQLLPARYNEQTTLTAEIVEQGANRLSFPLESKNP